VSKPNGFFKNTIVGGILVLLPVLLLCLLLSEVLQLVVALATPIAELLQEGGLEKAANPVLVALLLLVGASFIIGIIMQSRIGRRFGQWLEKMTVQRLPIYSALKRLTRSFVGTEEGETFMPALFEVDAETQEVVYVVETSEDGLVAVMVPHAPAAFTGPVKIVARERLTFLDTNIGDLSRSLSHWGVGTVPLASKKFTSGKES